MGGGLSEAHDCLRLNESQESAGCDGRRWCFGDPSTQIRPGTSDLSCTRHSTGPTNRVVSSRLSTRQRDRARRWWKSFGFTRTGEPTAIARRSIVHLAASATGAKACARVQAQLTASGWDLSSTAPWPSPRHARLEPRCGSAAHVHHQSRCESATRDKLRHRAARLATES